MRNLSRRDLVATAAASLAVARPAWAQGGKITAGEVVDRVQKKIVENTGVPWGTASQRDTFKIAGPDTQVTGIATTFGTNLRVMQLASKAGLNMIITHEPTFWSDFDVISEVQNDEIYKIKTDFAKAHNMVVWRIHDHWHAHKPDGIHTGWNKAMGWDRYVVDGNINRYDIPPTTLGQLARYVAKTLDTRSVRVIGDPNLPVTKVAYGGHGLDNNMAVFPAADCLVVSEAREYDSFEYVRDTLATGAKKGVIFISHLSGEDEGMHYFAEWSQPFLPEIPVRYVATTDEFWTV